MIIGIVLVFAVKLADHPYRRLWKEPLLFDRQVKEDVTVQYTDRKQWMITGCRTNAVTETSSDFAEYYDTIAKAQQIEIISRDSNSPTQKLSDESDIKQFMDALDVENWELAALPDNAEKSGTFIFSQNRTLKLGEDKAASNTYDVMEMYLYKNVPYVTLKIFGSDFDFIATNETMEYLKALLL